MFEAFGGYGSQSLALRRLRERYPCFDFKVVGYSDIEDAAIKAYMALHEGENVVNYGDISKIDYDEVPDFDLFTYSFPCTDTSAASRARRRRISVTHHGRRKTFASIRECSENTGIPMSRICECARHGMTYQNEYSFSYL